MRSGSDYRLFVVDPMTIDGGISSPPIRAFKNFRAITKIRTERCLLYPCYYDTIKSISQSHMLIICSHQMPDFSAKMHQIQFLPLPKNPTPAIGPSVPTALAPKSKSETPL